MPTPSFRTDSVCLPLPWGPQPSTGDRQGARSTWALKGHERIPHPPTPPLCLFESSPGVEVTRYPQIRLECRLVGMGLTYQCPLPTLGRGKWNKDLRLYRMLYLISNEIKAAQLHSLRSDVSSFLPPTYGLPALLFCDSVSLCRPS